MAIREILHLPDPRLANVAEPVETIDDDIQTLIDDMFETMYAAPGVGLAATQIGIAKRIAVMDCSQDRSQPLVMINPEILELDNFERTPEACLSVPNVGDTIKRARRVVFKATDRKGQVYQMEAEDLLAQCVQHEIDHLDGKLYVDHLSTLKRSRLRKKYDRQMREQAKNTQ